MAYTGSGAVWAMKVGDFVAANFAGTAVGIQAAIDHCGSTGGTVMIGPGTFAFGTSVLVIPSGKVKIKGAGIRTTKLTYSGSGDFITNGVNDGLHAGVIEAYNGTGSQTVIEDLWIQGADTGRGIVDWDSGSTVYNRLTISDFATGYFGIGADVVSFHDVNFSSNGTGCHLGSRSDQNQFHNCYFPQNTIGLLVEYAFNTRLFGGQFVFNTTADIVVDCPVSATSGGDVRNEAGEVSCFGTWFESDAAVNLDRHLWMGRNGTSSRMALGLYLFGCFFLCSNTDYLIEVDAGSEIHMFGCSQIGTVTVGFVLVNSVASVFPIIHVDSNRLASGSSKPLFNGAGVGHNQEASPRGARSSAPIAFAASITPGASVNGQEHIEVAALTGNITINAPSGNVPRGKELVFRFLQDATGLRTVTWNAVFKHAWSDVGNTANKTSTIRFRFDNTNWIQIGAQSPYF